MPGKTIEDRINTVYGGGGHVVILGAGASIASTIRNAEANSKRLPTMDNFIDVVGLRDIVERLPDDLVAFNFEDLYSKLHVTDSDSAEIREIESRVRSYFSDMLLSNEPTIYDYMVLALRPKDIIATFNWDPFLYQAWCRNRHVGDLPYIAFLHGNVALGYDYIGKRSGPAGMFSKETYEEFVPTKLLFPVTQKNYNSDEFIDKQWGMTMGFLEDRDVARVTIFGYGAPKSDIEAISLLNSAWGTGDQRVMEQFEMIDVRDERTVKESWDNFINSHHYDYITSYFESSLARNPRRTFESYRQHYLSESPSQALSRSNPVPSDFVTLQQLWDWHRPLIEAEERWKNEHA